MFITMVLRCHYSQQISKHFSLKFLTILIDDSRFSNSSRFSDSSRFFKKVLGFLKQFSVFQNSSRFFKTLLGFQNNL